MGTRIWTRPTPRCTRACALAMIRATRACGCSRRAHVWRVFTQRTKSRMTSWTFFFGRYSIFLSRVSASRPAFSITTIFTTSLTWMVSSTLSSPTMTYYIALEFSSHAGLRIGTNVLSVISFRCHTPTLLFYSLPLHSFSLQLDYNLSEVLTSILFYSVSQFRVIFVVYKEFYGKGLCDSSP